MEKKRVRPSQTGRLDVPGDDFENFLSFTNFEKESAFGLSRGIMKPSKMPKLCSARLTAWGFGAWARAVGPDEHRQPRHLKKHWPKSVKVFRASFKATKLNRNFMTLQDLEDYWRES